MGLLERKGQDGRKDEEESKSSSIPDHCFGLRDHFPPAHFPGEWEVD